MTVGDTAARAQSLGLRETKKNERRRRIITVARQLFHERGFDQTTTAEIAKKARVGPATLFRYVRDKDELLLLVIQDDLKDATQSGTAAMNGRGSLATRLLRLYRARFDFWAANAGLTTSAATTILAGEASGTHASFSRIGRSQARLLTVISEVLQKHADEQGIPLRKDAAIVALAVHHLYIGELREWINAGDPSIDGAMARLQVHFELLIHGAFRETATSKRKR